MEDWREGDECGLKLLAESCPDLLLPAGYVPLPTRRARSGVWCILTGAVETTARAPAHTQCGCARGPPSSLATNTSACASSAWFG